MPRRMLDTDISLSETVESCSEWAQLLFVYMIAHQDEWGRLVGQPAKVKAKVKPLCRRGPVQFEKAIRQLARAGLICWYAAEGVTAIAYRPASFNEYQGNTHQKALSQGRRSKLPAPPLASFRWPEDGPLPKAPEECGTLLESPGQEKLREGYVTKPNSTEEEGAGANAPPPPPPPRAAWPAESAALKAIPGYPFDEERDRSLMDSLAQAYPQLDLAAEVRKMRAWCQANGKLPMQGQAGPRRRVRNWMEKADEISSRRTGTGRAGGANVGAAWRRTSGHR